MNILFLGYWGANEGLSQATILPHLKILSSFSNINKIIYCSIERNGDTKFNIQDPKVVHIPLYSKKSKIPFLENVTNFIDFPNQIVFICKEYGIERVICRGALAGSLGYLSWKKTKIKYIVESYEPHSEYMIESGVWAKYDPRYIFQKYFELKQSKTAYGLMPVAYNFKKKLISQGVPENKIDVVPCCVNTTIFKRE